MRWTKNQTVILCWFKNQQIQKIEEIRWFAGLAKLQISEQTPKHAQ